MFCVTQKDILNVYREEGKVREYNMCIDYLRLTNMEEKEISKDAACSFCVDYPILLKWKKGKSCPTGIKALKFLKEKKLLPYHPNERTARIVGFLHGDGYLTDNLLGFGFVSKDKDLLLKLKEEFEEEFKIKGRLEKKREKGDIVFIHGKKVIARHPTYDVKFNSKVIGHLLFKLGVPKGKKVYQKILTPNWVMNGNKSIQKSFLQGLFDSELSNASISTFKRHKDNLSSPRMEMCKSKYFENNLRTYLAQIRLLLEKFNVSSKIAYLRKYSKLENISLTLVIHNRLANIYYFIDRVGFYYNLQRKKEALKVKALALEKIKRKNTLFEVLDYCKDKTSFTLKELEQDLKMSTSYTKIIGWYIYSNNFTDRIRREDRWFEYYPNHMKITRVLENPLLLETLPRIKKWRKKNQNIIGQTLPLIRL